MLAVAKRLRPVRNSQLFLTFAKERWITFAGVCGIWVCSVGSSVCSGGIRFGNPSVQPGSARERVNKPPRRGGVAA